MKGKLIGCDLALGKVTRKAAHKIAPMNFFGTRWRKLHEVTKHTKNDGGLAQNKEPSDA